MILFVSTRISVFFLFCYVCFVCGFMYESFVDRCIYFGDSYVSIVVGEEFGVRRFCREVGF